MSVIEAILLGVIQGVTEFLPISSTAHLTLAGKLMGMAGHGSPAEWTATIAIIQLGTAGAVVLYFRRDLWSIYLGVVSDFRRKNILHPTAWSPESQLLMLICIGTVPIVVLGLLFREIIEGDLTKDTRLIALSLIGLALLLLWAELVGKRKRTMEGKTLMDAIVVGFAQAVALIPGASRSGTTITAGLFLGFTRETAARFSFLLSIPAVVGSGIFELFRVWNQISARDAGSLVIAVAVSALTGYFSIAFLLRLLRKHSTAGFILYRIAVGALLLGLL